MREFFIAMIIFTFSETLSAQNDQLRNPFSAPLRENSRTDTGTVVFGQYNQNINNARLDYIPRIHITGVMSAKGKQIACANIEGLGNLILKTGDRIVIPVNGKKRFSSWILIRSIKNDKMTIQLDDGSTVSGRLF